MRKLFAISCLGFFLVGCSGAMPFERRLSPTDWQVCDGFARQISEAEKMDQDRMLRKYEQFGCHKGI